MSVFDLDHIEQEAEAVSFHSPYPVDTAIAVVNDCFRTAGREPVPDETWFEWVGDTGEYWEEQMGILAHLLHATSLREATVTALREASDDRRTELRDFFYRIEPLTAEMIRSNAFRREEALRRWAEWCGGAIKGESAAESQEHLERLDYRKTLKEYQRAEAAREEEREKRVEKQKEQNGSARGWRE